MSKYHYSQEMPRAPHLTGVDYVTAVIGIFLLLIGTYWIVYGKTFEGPVSSPKLRRLRVAFAYGGANDRNST